MTNSYNARTNLTVNNKEYEIYSLQALEQASALARLPFSHKILLENLLRNEDGVNITKADISALANWDAEAEPSREIAFTPARVLMQDFTGVPAVVDLAAMRDAMSKLGGDPNKINPLSPAELVIDHSVQVDVFGTENAMAKNAEIEFDRNKERYEFLRWGQQAFSNFKVVPPDTGIVHQVNLEYLARTVFTREQDGKLQAYPDTVVGTDSHTTMINGIGVLGWGVGGIEAEAAMLGQPITMLIPQVVGFQLTGQLAEGATATDLVLTVVEILRAKGVVGKFVEFYGAGLQNLPLADRATIANMGPEYGATCGIFPIDQETINYLLLSGRSKEQCDLVEAYAKAQGMWLDADSPEAVYTDTLQLDMSTVEPSLAGPKRPQDRMPLRESQAIYQKHLFEATKERGDGGTVSVSPEKGESYELKDGAIVIAAITSCTNTSNPSVMVGAGLVAKKAREKGLQVKPWVKTSLAPGSLVVRNYLEKAKLIPALNNLGFNIVGYGCTTCIGNSGPLPAAVSKGIPPLVVVYAIAGTMNIDLLNEALGQDSDGKDVYLKDIWPSQKEINDILTTTINSDMYQQGYENVFSGDSRWAGLSVTESERYRWNENSTYVQNPPYFTDMGKEASGLEQIKGARVLAKLGDSITTDHISPAGGIKADSPAGRYLIDNGVQPVDFNSYGSRRGNHEVMMRGTFANIRLRNQLAPGTEGGWTGYQPGGEQMSIYDAAMKYQENNIPLLVIAGKEYGTGSSRDWAAKGTKLLGVKAVLTESFERIHRSNLIGMGVLPLNFKPGDSADALGLSGEESYDIEGLETGVKEVSVIGAPIKFNVTVRVDTPKEWDYYNNGGILHYVLRQLAA